MSSMSFNSLVSRSGAIAVTKRCPSLASTRAQHTTGSVKYPASPCSGSAFLPQTAPQPGSAGIICRIVRSFSSRSSIGSMLPPFFHGFVFRDPYTGCQLFLCACLTEAESSNAPEKLSCRHRRLYEQRPHSLCVGWMEKRDCATSAARSVRASSVTALLLVVPLLHLLASHRGFLLDLLQGSDTLHTFSVEHASKRGPSSSQFHRRALYTRFPRFVNALVSDNTKVGLKTVHFFGYLTERLSYHSLLPLVPFNPSLSRQRR